MTSKISLLGMGMFLLALAVSVAQAEIIKRVNPDGSNTFIVPQKAPSVDSAGPCGVNPDDVLTVDGARDAYRLARQRLAVEPGNITCRQNLARLGRLLSGSEPRVANDLNASSPGTSPLPIPDGTPPGVVPAQ